MYDRSVEFFSRLILFLYAVEPKNAIGERERDEGGWVHISCLKCGEVVILKCLAIHDLTNC